MAHSVLTNCKLYMAGYDLSGDLNGIALRSGAELLDATTFGTDTRRRLGGLKTVDLEHRGLFSAGTNEADETLFSRIGVADVPVTVCPTTGADGERAYFFLATHGEYSPELAHGEVAKFAVSAEASGSPLVRGTVLVNGTKTATGTGTAYQVGRVLGARTNGWTWSEELQRGEWTTTNTTVTANAAMAPNGRMVADKLVETTSSSAHSLLRSTPTLSDSTSQAVSFYVKAAGRSWISVVTTDKANVGKTSYFNVSTGTSGTIDAGHAASITPVGDGWFRIGIVWSSGTGANGPRVSITLAEADSDVSYTGDGVSGVYLWGIQFEVDKSSVGPYIPTAADTASALGKKLYAVLHVPRGVLGTTPTLNVKIQSAADSGFSSPTDRITFTQVTSSSQSQYATPVSGEITDEYWRATWTIGGTTPSFPIVCAMGIL